MRFLLLIATLAFTSNDNPDTTRCFKGILQVGDEFFLLLNKDNTYEMSYVWYFHNQRSTAREVGVFKETKLAILLNERTNNGNPTEVKKSKNKLLYPFALSTITFRRCKCTCFNKETKKIFAETIPDTVSVK